MNGYTNNCRKYYREKDPMERLKLLEQSIAREKNRKKTGSARNSGRSSYSDKAETGDTRADGYLGLWMTMEFNRNSASRFFGTRSAKKEIGKYLTKLKFQEIQEKGGLYEELLYRECCHMVLVYMDLCQTDKSYNTTIFSLIHIKEDSEGQGPETSGKQQLELPANLGMEAELGIITRVAREIYRQYYPNEGNI